MQREGMYLLTCVPNEDTNQPASSLSPLRNLVSLAIQNAPSEDFDQTVRPYLPYVPIYHKYLDRHAWANSVDPESSMFDIYPAIFTNTNRLIQQLSHT